MPAAAFVPLIVGGVSAGASVYGARSQANTSRQALRSQEESSNRAYQSDLEDRDYQRQLAEQRDREAKERYEAEQNLARQMWEAEQEERNRKFAREDEMFQWARDDRQAEIDARNNRGSFDYGPYIPPPEDPRKAARKALQQQALQTLGDLLKQPSPAARPNATAPIAGPLGGY